MSARDFDVVVIGSGVAGVAAALETRDRGASVLVVEAADRIGGASTMSGAACCLVGTPEQAAAGITDSVGLALSDWAAFGGETADLEWAAAYLRDSLKDVHDWCADRGVHWSTPQLTEGNSVPRWHLPDTFGPGIVNAIVTELRDKSVPILLGTSATEILLGSGGASGIRISGAGGPAEIRARAVIVCSGGFANNRDMLKEANPRLFESPRVLQGGSPTALGRGHGLLGNIGAEFVSMDKVWVYPNGTPDPQDRSGRRGLGLRGVVTDVWLNLNGDRFHNEAHRGGYSGTNALMAQPQRTVWSVFDASELPSVLLIDNEHYATPSGPHPEAMARFWEESRYAVRAGSIEELAQRTGLPCPNVSAAISEFNEAIADGRADDPLTGRDLAGLAQIGTGGFAAVQFFPMAQKNFGGVRTDLQCRVLDAEGNAIPGVYAAGEVAGMAGGSINGIAGLEGTMFGPSLYSGRLAGRNAAF